MSFVIDTNILLHAANGASPLHSKAAGFLRDVLDSSQVCCFTWGILYEFLRVSTHSRVFPHPLSAAKACGYLVPIIEREETSILVPTGRHWEMLKNTVAGVPHPSGNLFHDITTAVLMREHGIRDIITADTDFLQFAFLKVTNPLL